MEKKKREQIILIILIPIFIASFLYTRLKGQSPAKRSYQTTGLGTEYAGEAMVKADETIDSIPRPAGTLDVKYKESARDLLKDLLDLYLHQLRMDEGGKPGFDKPVIPLPQLEIAGLIWSTEMPQAIINGKIIKAGETVQGVKVVSIGKKGITVIHEGELVFISKDRE